MQVLAEPGWCYVVHLAATGGLALAARSITEPAASPHAVQPGQPGQRAGSATSGEEAAALGGQLAGLSLGGGSEREQEGSFDDPLRRPTAAEPPRTAAQGLGGRQSSGSRRGSAHSGAAGAGGASEGATAAGLQLFTGFVSFEQLEDAMGSR